MPLQHQDDYNEFEATGNLVCHRRDRADTRRRRHTHTYFPEAVLANWIAEIMPSIGHLIEHIGPAEDRVRQRNALRHVLEQKVIEAESICLNRKAEAMDKARKNALGLGLEPKSSHFEQTVAAIADAMVAHETDGLSDLRNQLETLDKAAQSDRADVRQRAHLTEVDRWPDLDEKAQNLILRAIFDKIVISPSPFLASQKKALLEEGADAAVINQGTITLHLNGVADPLPPIRMFRGGHSGRAVCLQEPTDWLAEMFGIERPLSSDSDSIPSAPVACKINSRMRVSFFAYMRRRYVSDSHAEIVNDPVADLASAIKKDKGQPRARLTVKHAGKEYLIARGFAPEIIGALDLAWQQYLESERSRIIPLLAAIHGIEAVDTAWREFMSTQV